jgi:hypothetical protein
VVVLPPTGPDVSVRTGFLAQAERKSAAAASDRPMILETFFMVVQ